MDGEDQMVTFEKVDDLTVRMTLPTASAAFLLQQRFFIMPKHKLESFSVEGGAQAADINNALPTTGPVTDVVGTGPYMLTDYVPGQKVTLQKNPNYWKTDSAGTQLPYIDTLEFLIIRGAEAQLAQFLAGNIDELNISGAQFPDLKSREVAGADFRVVQSTALFGSPPHLAFNFDASDPDLAEVFSDLRFRQAMQSALDPPAHHRDCVQRLSNPARHADRAGRPAPFTRTRPSCWAASTWTPPRPCSTRWA